MRKFLLIYLLLLVSVLSLEHYWLTHVHKPPVFKHEAEDRIKKWHELDASFTPRRLAQLEAEVFGVNTTPIMVCTKFEFEEVVIQVPEEVDPENQDNEESIEDNGDDTATKPEAVKNCVSSSDARCKYEPL